MTNSRRKRVALALSALLLALGLLLLAAPAIGQWAYARKAEGESAAFAARTESWTPGLQEGLYREMVAYNRQLYESAQSGLVDAFSYEQVDFSLKAFGFEEEVIGVLDIPKIDLHLPIYLGASKENLDRGAAHLSQTSLPVGGGDTNAVIAAHRGMPMAQMFRYIDRLEVGDEFTLTNFRETLRYRVASVAVIRPDEVDKILIQPGRDLVTLISCNPYGSNTERYVVYAERA